MRVFGNFEEILRQRQENIKTNDSDYISFTQCTEILFSATYWRHISQFAIISENCVDQKINDFFKLLLKFLKKKFGKFLRKIWNKYFRKFLEKTWSGFENIFK